MDEAYRVGRLVAQPFGEDGLRVAGAREAVAALMDAPVGDQIGVVVIGPMDKTRSPEACDVLLKSIEEFSPLVQPMLWADDVGGVIGTIRSRCEERWSPAREDTEDDEEIIKASWDLLDACLRGDVHKIPAIVTSHKGKEVKLIEGLASALSTDFTGPRVELWNRLRLVARWRNPSPIEIVAALVQ